MSDNLSEAGMNYIDRFEKFQNFWGYFFQLFTLVAEWAGVLPTANAPRKFPCSSSQDIPSFLSSGGKLNRKVTAQRNCCSLVTCLEMSRSACTFLPVKIAQPWNISHSLIETRHEDLSAWNIKHIRIDNLMNDSSHRKVARPFHLLNYFPGVDCK